MLGELYGTPVPAAPPGHDIVLEIDVQGAAQVLAACQDVVTVLLVPPSTEDQAQRLRGRGDADAHVQARLELAAAEIAAGRALADAVVVNDDVERATDELAGILEKARRGAS